MSKSLKIAVIVFGTLVVLFSAAQLIRPERTNPATNASQTIQAHVGTKSGLVDILNRACRDCHSNETVWSNYTQVAPMSWLVAYGVGQGRKAVNFSEWGTYSLEQQRSLLTVACQDVTSGKMPGSAYTTFYPAARLSAHDVEAICAAVR
jgi:hypothetical protein